MYDHNDKTNVLYIRINKFVSNPQNLYFSAAEDRMIYIHFSQLCIKLDLVAIINYLNLYKNMNLLNKFNGWFSYYICFTRDIEMVKFVIQYGANLNLSRYYNILNHFAFREDEEIVRYLLLHGASIDLIYDWSPQYLYVKKIANKYE